MQKEFEQTLKRRLKERGIDVELMAKAPELARLPQVNRAIHVCKDTQQDALRFTGVPQTEWYFEGVIYLVDHVMFLIDKNVASDWGFCDRV